MTGQEPSAADRRRPSVVERPPSGSGRMGVTVENAATTAPGAGVPVRRGAVVVAVAPGSPADVLGIRPGNVIVAIEGRVIQNAAGLIEEIGATVPGQQIEISFYRGESLVRMPLRLAGQDGLAIGRGPGEARLDAHQSSGGRASGWPVLPAAPVRPARHRPACSADSGKRSAGCSELLRLPAADRTPSLFGPTWRGRQPHNSSRPSKPRTQAQQTESHHSARRFLPPRSPHRRTISSRHLPQKQPMVRSRWQRSRCQRADRSPWQRSPCEVGSRSRPPRRSFRCRPRVPTRSVSCSIKCKRCSDGSMSSSVVWRSSRRRKRSGRRGYQRPVDQSAPTIRAASWLSPYSMSG